MSEKIVLSTLDHTWILDLDGTVLKHNGYKIDGKDTFLPGAKEFLSKISDKDLVIFITSRSEKYRQQTEIFLKENQIHFDHIIYDAPYGERILINDNKPSGLTMSKAICLERDSGIRIDIELDEAL